MVWYYWWASKHSQDEEYWQFYQEIWNKRILRNETNSVDFVVQRIMEDIIKKLFGIKLGFLGLDGEICKKWNIIVKNGRCIHGD